MQVVSLVVAVVWVVPLVVCWAGGGGGWVVALVVALVLLIDVVVCNRVVALMVALVLDRRAGWVLALLIAVVVWNLKEIKWEPTGSYVSKIQICNITKRP
jgi:hypothetical protein